jgi:deoxycytidine triphosphate deaminase
MIISAKKIIELNKKYHLIKNLAERELNPQGVGIDVRAGGVYKLKEEGFLGVSDEDRKTPAIEKIADANQKKSS